MRLVISVEAVADTDTLITRARPSWQADLWLFRRPRVAIHVAVGPASARYRISLTGMSAVGDRRRPAARGRAGRPVRRRGRGLAGRRSDRRVVRPAMRKAAATAASGIRPRSGVHGGSASARGAAPGRARRRAAAGAAGQKAQLRSLVANVGTWRITGLPGIGGQQTSARVTESDSGRTSSPAPPVHGPPIARSDPAVAVPGGPTCADLRQQLRGRTWRLEGPQCSPRFGRVSGLLCFH
jgi:hypothetical protein